MEGLLLIGFIVWFIYMWNKSPTQTQKQYNVQKTMNQNMICPHCQTQGSVTTKQVKKKTGIHGGKATAAILTCGISMLGTGLSRKQQVTEAHCNNCGATWNF